MTPRRAGKRAPSVPPEITGIEAGVVRPRDARDLYTNPAAEFQRLARNNVLRHIAHGYYVVVPAEHLGDPSWRPPLEAVALGVAQADRGRDEAALMGISAARYHGALPRAHGIAIVACEVVRRPLDTTVGRVRFVTRDPQELDLVAAHTELQEGWVTSPEQTILDLADRPELGGLGSPDVADAIQALSGSCDFELVAELARTQHKPSAYARAAWLATVAGVDVPGPIGTGPVSSRGLPAAEADEVDAHFDVRRT